MSEASLQAGLFRFPPIEQQAHNAWIATRAAISARAEYGAALWMWQQQQTKGGLFQMQVEALFMCTNWQVGHRGELG
jgi:hypothetical protein